MEKSPPIERKKPLARVELQRIVGRVADQIESEVSFFNGWSVSEEAQREACEKAARKAVRYLREQLYSANAALRHPGSTPQDTDAK